MSYPVNQKFNPSITPQMGVNNAGQNNNYLPLQDVVPNVDTSSMPAPVSQAVNQDNPLVTLGIMVPTFLGIVAIMNKFNKACQTRVDGKPNMLEKMQDFGNKLNNNSIFKSQSFNSIQGAFESVKSFMHKKIENSNILKAIFRTPSEPSVQMVKPQMCGTSAEVASAAAQFFERYTDGGTDIEKIKELGFKNLEEFRAIKEAPEKYIARITEICEKQGSQKCLKIEKAGKIWGSETLFGKPKYFSELLPGFAKKALVQNVYFSEYANKLKAMEGISRDGKAVSALGKFIPRSCLKLLESLTFGMTGGKLGIFMASFALADAFKATGKGEGTGDKIKTFIEQMVSLSAWYLTFPLSMKMLYKPGGLKYLNMKGDAGKLDSYRDALKNLNERAKSGLIANKSEYNLQKRLLSLRILGLDPKKATELENSISQQFGSNSGDMKQAEKAFIEKELKPIEAGLKKSSSMLYKPLRFIGKTLTLGLETVHPFIPKNTGKVGGFFKKIGWRSVRFAGGAARFALIGFVLSNYFSNLAAKGSDLVFGRPKHSVLDKETDEESTESEQIPVMALTSPMVTPEALRVANANPGRTLSPVQGQAVNNNNMQQTGPTVPRQALSNNIQQTASNVQPQAVYQQPAPVRRYIPSPEPVKAQAYQQPQQSKVPARNYIPSPMGTPVATQQSPQADKKSQDAINKSIAAEKYATTFVK